MNIIKRLFGFKEQEDFETVLEELEEKIKKTQFDLSRNVVQERNIINSFLLISLITYSFLGLTLIYYQSFRLKVAMLLGPVWIWLIRYILMQFFQRQRNIKVEMLVALQSQQQLKVEELKKKTSYYLTKGLIERYESPSKPGSNNSPKPSTFTPLPQSGPNTPSLHKKPVVPNNSTPIGTAVLGINSQLRSANQNDTNTPTKSGKKATSKPSKPSVASPRTWIDRVLDAVVGESDGPQHKYALICESCFVHNGLVPQNEYHDAKFKCMACGFLNSKTIRSAHSGELREPAKELQLLPQSHHSQHQILKNPDGFDLDESFPAIDPSRDKESTFKHSSSEADEGHDLVDSLDDGSENAIPTGLDNVTESLESKTYLLSRKKKKKSRAKE